MKKNFVVTGLIFSVLVLVLFVCGCTQQGNEQYQNNTGANTTFVAIKNPERMFHRTLSVVKPTEWREVEYGGALIYLPEGSEIVDPLSEKITFAVGFLPKNDDVPLSTMMDDDIRETRKIMPDIQEVTEKTPAKIGPLDGLTAKYTATIQQQIFEINQIDAIYATVKYKNDIIYKVGHACRKNDCRYSDVFSEMVKSFEPREPEETV